MGISKNVFRVWKIKKAHSEKTSYISGNGTFSDISGGNLKNKNFLNSEMDPLKRKCIILVRKNKTF